MTDRTRARAERPPPESESPLISIVLPVRNEARFIAGTISQLQAQRYPRDRAEFLVCDGASEDGTRNIVRDLARDDPRIKLLDNPARRSSSGRNVGFKAARGEIILVIDGHVKIPGDRLFSALADCFRRSRADCLGRPQPLIPERGNRWSEAIALARGSALGHSRDSLIYSGYEGFAPAASIGAAYRPAVFERIGFVDESFDACEDLEFNTRLDLAGLRCYTSQELTVYYYARSSVRALFRQMYRYGFGRFKYVLRHPSRLSLGQLVPAAMVVGILLLPLLPIFSPALARLAFGLAGVYVLAVAGESLRLGIKTGRGLIARCLVVFPTIHLALGLGFIVAILKGGRLDPRRKGGNLLQAE